MYMLSKGHFEAEDYRGYIVKKYQLEQFTRTKKEAMTCIARKVEQNGNLDGAILALSLSDLAVIEDFGFFYEGGDFSTLQILVALLLSNQGSQRTSSNFEMRCLSISSRLVHRNGR